MGDDADGRGVLLELDESDRVDVVEIDKSKKLVLLRKERESRGQRAGEAKRDGGKETATNSIVFVVRQLLRSEHEPALFPVLFE